MCVCGQLNTIRETILGSPSRFSSICSKLVTVSLPRMEEDTPEIDINNSDILNIMSHCNWRGEFLSALSSPFFAEGSLNDNDKKGAERFLLMVLGNWNCLNLPQCSDVSFSLLRTFPTSRITYSWHLLYEYFTNLAIMPDTSGRRSSQSMDIVPYSVPFVFYYEFLKNHPPCFSISYLDSGSGDQYINITRAWQPNDCYVSSSQSQRNL